MSVVEAPPVPPAARLGPREWREIAMLVGIALAMSVAGWALLLFLVAPSEFDVGGQVFGIGLGLTAFTLGVRHAFDADHIAAIDNTTRRLLSQGRRPVSVGFWFALGHSTVVVVLAVGVAAGARYLVDLTDDGSAVRHGLGVVGASVSGLFLWLIGVLNLIALVGIARFWRRRASADPAELDDLLDKRGFFNRLLRPLLGSIRHPAQMYPVGLLFGVGFDTATEVALLVLAGTGAAAGLPWYAILVLPLLFTSGMTLFDTLDGAFMTAAYRWAYAQPVRRVFYNLTTTGLSVAVALLIGTVQIVGVLHDELRWQDPLSGWVAGLDLNNVGFVVLGLFVGVWLLAVAYWKLTGLGRAAGAGADGGGDLGP